MDAGGVSEILLVNNFAFVILQDLQLLNNSWHLHCICLYGSYSSFIFKQTCLWFCRDFMHIVLVHYLEIKVTPNPFYGFNVDSYLFTLRSLTLMINQELEIGRAHV